MSRNIKEFKINDNLEKLTGIANFDILKHIPMKIKLLLAIIGITCIVLPMQAQTVRCGTNEHQAALDIMYPEVAAYRQSANEAINRIIENNPGYRINGTFNIPIVFHIIYNGAAQNISDNRIFDQMDVIYDDYTRNNADTVNTRSMFSAVCSGIPVEFCLAQQTPAGAATNGIVRIPTTLSSLPNNPSSISPEWDHTRYLNVYVGNLGGGLLGYTNFPPGSPNNDHIVVLYSAVGGPNFPGTLSPYHLGRTLTHEMGHWFNLYHTFEGGCSGLNANSCTSQGDHICDTPPLSGPTFGCPAGSPNTCTETSPFASPYSSNMPDMYENYMDYTDDGCMNCFTEDQGARMTAAITGLRPLLLTSTGCIPVGLAEVLDATYLTLTPNPSSGIFQVQFNFPVATDVQLEVSDLQGRVVYSNSFNTSTLSAMQLDMTRFSDGVYQLTAKTNNGYLVKRIVKTR